MVHKITIGNNEHSTASGSRLVFLQSKASLDAPVNVCRMILAPPQDLRIAVGDPVRAELGDDTQLEPVFTGKVVRRALGIEGVTVDAAGSFQYLLASNFNLVYEKSKAGEIVSDLAGRTGVTTEAVDGGVEFPAYALGDERAAYEHLRHFADLCGFDLYADREDKLIFAPYRPLSTHAFAYGVNILSCVLDERTPAFAGVEVYGESPSSLGQGADAYSWMTKQEVKGSAGSADGLLLRVREPAIKDVDTAGSAAQALLEKISVAKSGRLVAIGCPEAGLGDGLLISGMPDSSLNGEYKITGVMHRVSKQQGFLTTLEWSEA